MERLDVPAKPMVSLEEDLSPEELRVREAHHRIANDLAVLSTMVRLQSMGLEDGGALLLPADGRQMLAEVAGRIDAISRLHRALCANLNGQTPTIFIEDICAEASKIAAGRGVEVRCQAAVQGHVPMEQLRSVGLLMHELIMNSLKHAHPACAQGTINVRCQSEPDGSLSLVVEDDGVGLPVGFNPHTAQSFGMRLSRKLAAQLDGELSFESNDLGLTCRFRTAPTKVQS
ncbi:sensory transduction histidine kinase [alpha proteobacterium U9-1i]|nr:sensory transduction histidine kinase [alpha proteobacterium U9-1i]